MHNFENFAQMVVFSNFSIFDVTFKKKIFCYCFVNNNYVMFISLPVFNLIEVVRKCEKVPNFEEF